MAPRELSRLFGAIMAGWAATVGVAFLSGSAYAFLVGNGRGRFEWPPFEAVAGIGVVAALTTMPFALAIGSFVALPVFRYWVLRAPASVPRYLAAGLLFSVVGVLLVTLFNRAIDLVDSDYKLALTIAAISGPVSALA